MEHKEAQKQESITVSPQVPPSLLPGVMARLAQREALTGTRSIEPLRSTLQHAQWEMRAAAARALGEYGQQNKHALTEVRSLLLAALHDEHRLVRVATIRALARTGEPFPLEVLLISLQDSAWEVREIAALVLGELVDQPADPLQALLRVAQQDTHSSVRDAATYALRERCHFPDTKTISTRGVASYSQGNIIDFLTQFLRSCYAQARRCAAIFLHQIPLIHKSIWFTTPLLLVMWFIECFSLPQASAHSIQTVAFYLALFSTVSAGAGSAFIYGKERDVSLELVLSTPTSLRVLLFGRFMLVVGYNIALTVGVSIALVVVHGGGLWQIMQIWLGPVLFVSSLALMLSMLVGSFIAVSLSLLLEASQSLVFGMADHWSALHISFSHNWQTSPGVLLLAIALFALALFYAPRQTRLVSI